MVEINVTISVSTPHTPYMVMSLCMQNHIEDNQINFKFDTFLCISHMSCLQRGFYNIRKTCQYSLLTPEFTHITL